MLPGWKTWLCMSSVTSQGSHRLTHVCSAVCCVSSPWWQIKHPEKLGCYLASWGNYVFGDCQWLEFHKRSVFRALGGSDSLFGASGLVHTYILRTNERGRIKWVHLLFLKYFCSDTNWHWGRLSMFSTMPLVTFFWGFYFVLWFEFIVNRASLFW